MLKRQQSRTRIPEVCAISVNDIFVRVTDLSKASGFEFDCYCYYSICNMHKSSLVYSTATHVATCEQSHRIVFQTTSTCGFMSQLNCSGTQIANESVLRIHMCEYRRIANAYARPSCSKCAVRRWITLVCRLRESCTVAQHERKVAL